MICILCIFSNIYCFAYLIIHSSSMNDNNTSWIEHPEWGDVVRYSDGRIKSPFQTNMVSAIGYGICCFVGLPLNFYIIYSIVTNKRMYTKPRDIFLLFRIISGSLTLIEAIIDIINFKFHFEANEHLCRFYVLLMSLPRILFFLNLFLSLLDRYGALYHSMWHWRRITVRFVVISLLSSNLLVSMANISIIQQWVTNSKSSNN